MFNIKIAALLLAVVLLNGCASTAGFGPLSSKDRLTIPRPSEAPKTLTNNDVGADEDGSKKNAGVEYFGGSGKFLNEDVKPYQIKPDSSGGVAISFRKMDIRVIAQAILGDTLGEPFSIDPRVSGTGTLETSGAISKEALRISFEALLKTMGYALVNTSTGYTVLPRADAVRSVNDIQFNNPASVSLPGFRVHVVTLNHTLPSEMRQLIEPFSAPGGILRADDNRNMLILAGTPQELAGMFRAIETFDVDRMAGMSFAIFPLKYVEAEQVVAELNEVFQGLTNNSYSTVHLIPVPRINRIIGVAPDRRKLKEIESWIKKLDIGESSPGRRIYVYNVKNGRAADIASTLNQILDSGYAQGSRGGQTVGGSRGGRARTAQNSNRQTQRNRGDQRGNFNGFGEDTIRIVPSDENNSLVIMATPSEFGVVESALKKIDVAPRQVLVEVTLAEVGLTEELRFGLQWHFEFGGNQVTFGKSSQPSAELPGFSWTNTSNANASAVLNALETFSDVKVISAPKLLVLNNQSGTIQVGDQIPVPTSSAISRADSNAPIVNTIQYRDTGVILTVTPRINEGGLVMLDIQQEVSTVVATSSSGIDAPTIQQRRITTTVAVQSGSTIALGGLIRSSLSRSDSGIPFLKNIPFFGKLFKSENYVERRSELIILLTPRIIRNVDETREAMDYLQREFRSLIGPPNVED